MAAPMDPSTPRQHVVVVGADTTTVRPVEELTRGGEQSGIDAVLPSAEGDIVLGTELVGSRESFADAVASSVRWLACLTAGHGSWSPGW